VPFQFNGLKNAGAGVAQQGTHDVVKLALGFLGVFKEILARAQ
jgi:hypothetical protein